MPHEVIRAPEHERSRSLGWLAVEWMHHFCIHGKGDISGTPLNPRIDGAVPLSDELAGLTVDCYALERTGRRMYDSVFFSRPKGYDKSGHGARLALFEAMGPCRFAGWATGRQVFDWGTSAGEVFEWMDFRYEYQPGEPMGRPVLSPFVRVMATEESQTGNVYDVIWQNCYEGPLRYAFAREEDIGLSRVYLPDGGEIRPSTAGSASKDGGLESFAVFDETHLYNTNPLRTMYATVRRNLGKRNAAQPWSFEPSTMYKPGQNSVAEQSHKLAQDIRDGKARAARLLFDHREGYADTDVDDEASLRRGLEEAYRGADYMDIDRLITEFWDPRNDRGESIQFFLNRPTSAGGKAFDLEKWDANAVPMEEAEHYRRAGEKVALGFDGARTRDGTSLRATHLASGFQWTVGYWERPEGGDLTKWLAEHPGYEDWEIDEADVIAVVDDAMAKYDVRRFYADTSKWEGVVAQLAGKYNHEADDQKVIVVKWPVQLRKRTAIACKAYATAIIAGEVKHDGNPLSRAHIANSFRETTNFTDDDGSTLWLITKERPASPRKIDDAYSGVLSWQARLDAIAAGALVEDGPSVYEERGLTIL